MYLDTSSGLEPQGGEICTVYFNPFSTQLGPTMPEPPLFYADFNSKVGARSERGRAYGPNRLWVCFACSRCAATGP